MLLIAMMMLFASSCVRRADIEFPPHTPLLVLHSYTAVGEPFRASLGKTVESTVVVPGSATLITDGWILLYEDGAFKDSLRYDPVLELYQTPVKAESGKTYRLVAGHPDFPEVESVASAPLGVPTLNVQHIKNARTNADGIALNDVKFSFSDPPLENNFYLAALFPGYPGNSIGCVYTYDPSVERYTEGLLPFDQSNCIDGKEILFTDKSFNGKLKEITISATYFDLQTYVDPITGKEHKPYLKRYNITESFYKYFKHTSILDFNAGAPTLSDPIIIKGNVQNGYGLFTVYTAATDSLP